MNDARNNKIDEWEKKIKGNTRNHLRQNAGRSKNLREKCDKMETFLNKHDLFNFHKSVRELISWKNKRRSSILKNFNGETLMGVENKQKWCKVYAENLFKVLAPHAEDINEEIRDFVTKNEVTHVTKFQMDPGNIHTESLKFWWRWCWSKSHYSNTPSIFDPFEMYSFKQMLPIFWIERRTNVTVFQYMEKVIP